MPSIIDEVRSRGKDDVAFISALLFASEDYCASTGIIRTKSRREMLFPRAQMATIARAYNLAAIVSALCHEFWVEIHTNTAICHSLRTWSA